MPVRNASAAWMPKAGFYAGLIEENRNSAGRIAGRGFSAIFTTDNSSRPLVIITLPELVQTMRPVQKREKLSFEPLNNVPAFRQMADFGISFEEMVKAVKRLAFSVGEYGRGKKPDMTFESVDAWAQAYKQRNQIEKDPRLFRIGRPHFTDQLLALRRQEGFQASSFDGPRRMRSVPGRSPQ